MFEDQMNESLQFLRPGAWQREAPRVGVWSRGQLLVWGWGIRWKEGSEETPKADEEGTGGRTQGKKAKPQIPESEMSSQ